MQENRFSYSIHICRWSSILNLYIVQIWFVSWLNGFHMFQMPWNVQKGSLKINISFVPNDNFLADICVDCAETLQLHVVPHTFSTGGGEAGLLCPFPCLLPPDLPQSKRRSWICMDLLLLLCGLCVSCSSSIEIVVAKCGVLGTCARVARMGAEAPQQQQKHIMHIPLLSYFIVLLYDHAMALPLNSDTKCHDKAS